MIVPPGSRWQLVTAATVMSMGTLRQSFELGRYDWSLGSAAEAVTKGYSCSWETDGISQPLVVLLCCLAVAFSL